MAGRGLAQHRLHRHWLQAARLARQVSRGQVVEGPAGGHLGWEAEGGARGPTCWPRVVAKTRSVWAASTRRRCTTSTVPTLAMRRPNADMGCVCVCGKEGYLSLAKWAGQRATEWAGAAQARSVSWCGGTRGRGVVWGEVEVAGRRCVVPMQWAAAVSQVTSVDCPSRERQKIYRVPPESGRKQAGMRGPRTICSAGWC